MTAFPDTFYVSGGTLEPGTPSYVSRHADYELLEGLTRGRFCYVLTSRQMGKSSLMVRTAIRLREQGSVVATLDLTQAGANLTVEQWYYGLLRRLGEQIDLLEPLITFWRQNKETGPLTRFMDALRQVALPLLARPLVIFVDEIDYVRSLSFSTDEFFAAIRECYNRRAQDSVYNCLTFCLLGVATPSDLIQDTRTTPFNIGQRVELQDFSPQEAAPLAAGLGGPDIGPLLLTRVLYWTNGHPYLTQLLCQAIAERPHIRDSRDVDALCADLFFGQRAREQEKNLSFVQNMLLKSEVDRAGLLDMYATIWAGRRVKDEESNSLIAILRLSGIVRAEQGCLKVRNRVYHRVFDRAWTAAHMPDAEIRRQRAAYRKGLVRALSLSSIVLLMVSILAGVAIKQKLYADEKTKESNGHARAERLNALLAHDNEMKSRENLKLAQDNEVKAQQSAADAKIAQIRAIRGENAAKSNAMKAQIYADAKKKEANRANDGEKAMRLAILQKQKLISDLTTSRAATNTIRLRSDRFNYPIWMHLTQSALSEGAVSEAQTYLNRYLPPSPLAELRGFEWRYLMRECRGANKDTFNGHQNGISAVACSPNGSRIASMEKDGVVRIWDDSTGKPTHIIPSLNPQRSLVFLQDGHTLIVGARGYAIFYDTQTGKMLTPFPAHSKQGGELAVESLALSPDEKWLACGLHSGRIDLWDLFAKRLVKSLYSNSEGDNSEAFAPIRDLCFSPDGKTLASGCSDAAGKNSVTLWNLASFAVSGSFTYAPQGDNDWGRMSSLAFSPEGKYVVTGGDQVVRLWDVTTLKSIEIAQHSGSITKVVFAPNKRWLATSSKDSTIQLFDATGIDAGRLPILAATLHGHSKGVESVAFSVDSRTLVSGSLDKTLKLWDIDSVLQPALQAHNFNRVGPLCYSPDGRLLATGSYQEGNTLENKQVRIWDAQSRKMIAQTPPHIHGNGDSTYMCFAPDGKTVAVASADGTLALCDARTGKEVADFEGAHGVFNVIAFSPDGKWIATGDRKDTNEFNHPGHMVRLWDVATRREVREFAQRQTQGHVGWVLALAFSPDSKTLVSGGGRGELRWWDVAGQKEMESPQRMVKGRSLPSTSASQKDISSHQKDISSLTFSPNGLLLASGSEDNSAGLWEAKTHELVRFLRDNQGFVTSVAFTPDGKTLATSGIDGTIKLWSLANLSQNAPLKAVTLHGGHNGIRTLAFAPDGNTLATGHFDGVVLFWQGDGLPSTLGTQQRPALRK